MVEGQLILDMHCHSVEKTLILPKAELEKALFNVKTELFSYITVSIKSTAKKREDDIKIPSQASFFYKFLRITVYYILT